MKSPITRLIVVLFILASLTQGCGSGDKKQPTSTRRPTAVAVTKTPEPPTETPVPPTSTPVPPTSTPVVTATPTPDLSLGEENRCDECGFSFRPVTGYLMDISNSSVTMLAEGADPDTGPVIMLAGNKAEPGMTPEMMLEMFKGGEMELSDPVDIVVAGLNGLSAQITGVRGTTEMAGQVIVIVTEDQQFVALAGSPKEQWQREGSARFQAVLNSLSFFKPIVPVEVEPTPAVEPTPEPIGEITEIRQWAASATASSWYGTGTSWSPTQAAGEPNALDCGDDTHAWASLDSDTVEWIELMYVNPVVPSQVNIIQNYNPDAVIMVELFDTNGNYHEVYVGNAYAVETCPYTLSMPVEAGYEAVGVKITIDQSVLQNWTEIDAVELVGMGTVVSAPVETPAQGQIVAATPEGFVPPEGLLWRVGGATVLEVPGFTTLEGMDTDENNLVYMADGLKGIWVYDAAGEQVSVIDHPDLSMASDVKIGPDGNLYVAAWGNNEVFVFTPQGDLVTRFGEEGKGDGQFGTFSPQELAVAPDGRIFVFDENEDDAGEDVDRIQVFSATGQWLSAFPIVSEWDAPDGMSFGPDGNLYTVGFMSDTIVQYDLNGNVLNEIDIEDGLGGPQSLDMDADGNFYIASWDDGIVMLDPQGNLLGQWGVWAGDDAGELDWVGGTFYRPAGVAVLADGSQVFFCEWSNMYAYLTAFEFK